MMLSSYTPTPSISPITSKGILQGVAGPGSIAESVSDAAPDVPGVDQGTYVIVTPMATSSNAL